MEFLSSLIGFNPDLILIEGNLDEILKKISFLDFILVIQKYPLLYDNLQKNQTYWRKYYLKHYPHFPVEKQTFDEDYKLVVKPIEIDWFQQCCIQKDIYFFNSSDRLPSVFNLTTWNDFILESLTSEELSYERQIHSLEENLKNFRLSRLHNIKQIITEPFYKQIPDEDNFRINYETNVVVLFEDNKLYYYVKKIEMYPEDDAVNGAEVGNAIDIEDVEEEIVEDNVEVDIEEEEAEENISEEGDVDELEDDANNIEEYSKLNSRPQWLLNHVKYIQSIHYTVNGIDSIVLIQTIYNDFYLHLVDEDGNLYLRRINIDDMDDNYSFQDILKLKTGELSQIVLPSLYNSTIIKIKDIYERIFYLDLTLDDANNNPREYLLSNEPLSLQAELYFVPTEIEIEEIQFIDLDEGLTSVNPIQGNIEEKDIPYAERDIPYEEGDIDKGDMSSVEGNIVSDEGNIEILQFFIIHLMRTSPNYQVLDNVDLQIFLDKNYELHYLIRYNSPELIRFFDYNLSQHDPIISKLKIQKISLLETDVNIIQVYHENGVWWLFPIMDDEIPIDMINHLTNGANNDTYISFLQNNSFFNRKIEMNPKRSDIIAKYPDASRVEKIKDIIVNETTIPEADATYQVYLLDVLGNIFTFFLDYVTLTSVSSKSNSISGVDFSYQNFQLVAQNVTKFLFNPTERIIGLEVNINRYIIVPYAHYLEYTLKDNFKRELIIDGQYSIFQLTDSSSYFKAFLPETKE